MSHIYTRNLPWQVVEHCVTFPVSTHKGAIGRSATPSATASFRHGAFRWQDEAPSVANGPNTASVSRNHSYKSLMLASRIVPRDWSLQGHAIPGPRVLLQDSLAMLSLYDAPPVPLQFIGASVRWSEGPP